MGSTSSKEKQKGGVYAEIVSGKEDEAIPPLKVFINAQITSTAVDSLKDAHEMMYLLAENLIMEALKDGQTPKMFGQMLKHMLAYESTQCTTRQFLYWSMHSPHGYDNIRHISAWHMKDYINTYAPIQLSVAAQEWSLSLLSRRTVINPLLTWTLNHEDIVVGPLADIVKDTLPHTRVSCDSFCVVDTVRAKLFPPPVSTLLLALHSILL